MAVSVNVEENNENLDKIAKQLAVALRQKEMRIFLKKEALKKFDGDYDILYRNVKNLSVNGQPLKNYLINTNKGSISSLEAIESITEGMPLLNISIPVNINKWDEENFTPLVAVVSMDYDDKTATRVKAYDTDGKVHWLDANSAPDFPVIVVGTNERTEIKYGQVVLKHKPGTASSKKRVNITMANGKRRIVAQTFNDGEAGGGEEPGGTITCLRYDGNWEYMHGLTFPGSSLQQNYEDWILGAPEIRISAFKPVDNFTKLGEFLSHSYEPSKRADVNDEWDYFNGSWPLFMWYTADYGNIVIYKMIEEDSGQIIELTVSGQVEIPFTNQKVSLSGKINIKNDDDVGPTTPVDFRDDRCIKIYGDPTFQFQIKHQ